MNHSYVNYGNDYIVSDETGKMKVVNMDNSSIKARDIFDAENKLESLNLEFDECKKEYDFKRLDIIAGRIIGLVIIIAVSFLFNVIISVNLPMKATIGIAGTSFLSFKALSICCFGTIIGRLKEMKKLSSKINTLEKEIPTLGKKIDKMKKDTHYDDKTIEAPSNTDNHSYSFDKTENKSIDTPSNTDNHIDDFLSFNNQKEKPKVYVLSNGKKVN